MKKLTLLAMIVAVAASGSLFAGDFENIGSAIRTGDLIEVKRLVLEEKIDINQKDVRGETPVYRAVWSDNLEMVKLLVSCGADVKVQRNDGWTPVYLAVWKNNLEMVKLLVSCGVDIDEKDKDGKTALGRAQLGRRQEVIPFLEKIEKFTFSLKDSLTRDFPITTIFTGNKYSSDDKKLFLDIMAGQGYCKALKKVFELGCKTKGLFQELFGKEIMYEDVYKAEICSRFLDKPCVIKNLVSGNYYDATRIYDHYSDKQRMYENPKICVEIINEIKKQQMLNVIMAQRKGSNIFFNFK